MVNDISGYSGFYKSRQYQNVRAKRNAGGLLVLVKDSLCDIVSVKKENIDCDEIMCLVLDNLKMSLHLFICYIPPEGAQVYGK